MPSCPFGVFLLLFFGGGICTYLQSVEISFLCHILSLFINTIKPSIVWGSSTFLLFWILSCYGVITLCMWDNKHVGAWTCPTDALAALVFVTVVTNTMQTLHMERYTLAGLCILRNSLSGVINSCRQMNCLELWMGWLSIWLQSSVSLYEMELWNVLPVQKYELEKKKVLL